MMIRSTAGVLLIGAATVLVACNKQEAPANNTTTTTVTETNATAAQAATNEVPARPAAAPVGGAPTADYMVGKWSATGEDCKDTLEFRKDGTVITPIGPGKWTLVGDKLAFEYDGSKQDPSSIKVLSADRIEITTSSGRKETEKRCS